ncbi:GH11828, partial [Drosophila grimshawi]
DFSALAQSSATYTPQAQAASSGSFSQSNAFNAGFNGASQGGLLTQGYNPLQKPNGDLYKPSSGLSTYGSSSGLSQSGGFGQNGFSGSPSGSYHSQNPDYYKKELQNGGASAHYNGISSGYGAQGAQGGAYQGAYDTSRQQIVDCQCVPISQCPAADRIGRKEDLILPIDPRNLGKDIEALSDDAATNATAKADTKVDDKKVEDDKKRTRRQTDAENKQEDTGDLSLDAQGVSERNCFKSSLANPLVQVTARLMQLTHSKSNAPSIRYSYRALLPTQHTTHIPKNKNTHAHTPKHNTTQHTTQLNSTLKRTHRSTLHAQLNSTQT